MSHVRGNMDDREPRGVSTTPGINRLPISPKARWFDTHTQAVASLSELFDEDE